MDAPSALSSAFGLISVDSVKERVVDGEVRV